jgi:hypothetical protein
LEARTLDQGGRDEVEGRHRRWLSGAALRWIAILLFAVGGLLAIAWHMWEEGLPERSPKTVGVIRATVDLVRVAGDPPRPVSPPVTAFSRGERIGAAGQWQVVDIPGPRHVHAALFKVERERKTFVTASEALQIPRRGFEGRSFLFVMQGQAPGEYELRINLLDPNIANTFHEIVAQLFRVQ